MDLMDHTTSSRKKILFAEDEPIVQEAIGGLLEAMGFDVTLAKDGLEALVLFRTTPDEFLLVIVDQTMPKMTGCETLEAIWSIHPGMPAILTSGYQDRSFEDIRRRSSVCFLQKPFRLAELRDAIKLVCA
jgi:CheY-like chemotaxis protein